MCLGAEKCTPFTPVPFPRALAQDFAKRLDLQDRAFHQLAAEHQHDVDHLEDRFLVLDVGLCEN